MRPSKDRRRATLIEHFKFPISWILNLFSENISGESDEPSKISCRPQHTASLPLTVSSEAELAD